MNAQVRVGSIIRILPAIREDPKLAAYDGVIDKVCKITEHAHWNGTLDCHIKNLESKKLIQYYFNSNLLDNYEVLFY